MAIGVPPPQPLTEDAVEDLSIATISTGTTKGVKKGRAPKLVIDGDSLEDTPMQR